MVLAMSACRDVAEHSAEENQIGRDSARVGIRDRGICGDDLNSVETCRVRGAAREQHVVLVELDQASRDVRPPWMVGQYPDEIMSLPRAYADRPHGAAGGPIQRGAYLPLNQHQALTECRVRLLVVLMPCLPVHNGRETTATRTGIMSRCCPRPTAAITSGLSPRSGPRR